MAQERSMPYHHKKPFTYLSFIAKRKEEKAMGFGLLLYQKKKHFI